MRKEILDYISPEFLRSESKTKSFRQIARELGLEVSSITYWTKKWGIDSRYTAIKNEEVNQEQKQLIVASVLGDANLDKIKDTIYFREAHCLEQKEYVDWKFKKLSNLALSKPYTTDMYGFRLSTNSFTDSIYKEFYPDGSKRIPSFLEEYLSPLFLAVHYLDDGWINNRKDTLCISTAQFTKSENEYTSELYRKKFGFNFTIQPHYSSKYKKFYYYLRANKADSFLISELISPLVVPCMRYKLVEGVTTMHVPR